MMPYCRSADIPLGPDDRSPLRHPSPFPLRQPAVPNPEHVGLLQEISFDPESAVSIAGCCRDRRGAAVPPGANDLMPNDKVMEHLWRFSTLHAQQRVSVFNFYVILAGVISAAIGGAS